MNNRAVIATSIAALLILLRKDGPAAGRYPCCFSTGHPRMEVEDWPDWV
jgi:hypothetical protein